MKTVTLKLVGYNATSAFMTALHAAGVKPGAIIKASGGYYDTDVDCFVWPVVQTTSDIFDQSTLDGCWACITEYMIVNNGNVECLYKCFEII